MSKEIKSKIDKLFAEREKEFTSCIFTLNNFKIILLCVNLQLKLMSKV